VGIIESLTKLVDPAAARAREEELKVARETPKRDDAGTSPDRFECRVCGHRSAEGPFCPVCLAGTMERHRGSSC
jgi:rubrerythrin